MRDPKVEEFLAHTRLAAEGDAKADFERRVDRKVEAMVEELKGDTVGHAFHGNRYTGGEGASGPTTAGHFASRIVGALEAKPNHVMDAVQLRAAVTRGVDSRFKSLYDQGHASLEHAGAIRLVPGTAYPSYALVPEKAQAFKTAAAETDLKYSDSEPRDDHGRWGDGGGGVPGTMSRNGQIDHELDRSHSRWTQATSPMASELEKSGFRHALSDQPRAQTGVRAYDRGYDVGLGYKYPVTEGQRQINMQRFGSEKLPKLDTRTPAVALVSAPPHNRIGLRDAPEGETKADPEHPDPRVPAGRKRDPKHPYDGTTLPE